MKYPVNVVAVASGTGTVAKSGIITWSSATGKCYITVTSGTQIGTLISSTLGG